VQIADQAKAAAEAERPQEEAWLQQYCSSSTITP
jgi:hypothetical protein